MEITQEKLDGLVKLNIDGELDASTAINMDNELKALLEEGSTKVIFDCTNLH